jgi:hypothetical protein
LFFLDIPFLLLFFCFLSSFEVVGEDADEDEDEEVELSVLSVCSCSASCSSTSTTGLAALEAAAQIARGREATLRGLFFAMSNDRVPISPRSPPAMMGTL